MLVPVRGLHRLCREHLKQRPLIPWHWLTEAESPWRALNILTMCLKKLPVQVWRTRVRPNFLYGSLTKHLGLMLAIHSSTLLPITARDFCQEFATHGLLQVLLVTSFRLVICLLYIVVGGRGRWATFVGTQTTQKWCFNNVGLGRISLRRKEGLGTGKTQVWVLALKQVSELFIWGPKHVLTS